MKLLNTIVFFILLLVTGCATDSGLQPDEGAFYKLYGNGTFQEAVSMSIAPAGDIFITGNQYVRNQDSAAVVLIRTNAEGNQLWSGRYFGKGYSSSKAILILPSNEVLLLASSRKADQAGSVPVIYRISEQGELLNEYFIEQDRGADSGTENKVPEGMVLGENGAVFLAGNIIDETGKSIKSFIEKIDLNTGKILDSREFNNSEMTEVKAIYRAGDKFVVVGNTRQQTDEVQNQSIFVALFSANLVEAQHMVIGSLENDTFKEAMVSTGNEFVIISSEQSVGSPVGRGVLSFLDNATLRVKRRAYLDFSANEIPEAICEDEDGNFMVAVNTFGERGETNIIINKMAPSGTAVWGSPKEIGGEGSDKIAQVKMMGGYTYLLSTIDMQNENTLMSLSRIRF